jgi:hypothetical protein
VVRLFYLESYLAIGDMYRFSETIIDIFQWEAIFRKYNLYCTGMWQDDGWPGTNLNNTIVRK